MKLNDSVLEELCQVAKVAATEAGQYIQSKFDQHYVKQSKEGGDSLASQVVTEVDIHAQEIILAQLESSIRTYDLGLLTEEETDDKSRLKKDYFWCIDPMDGTLPFTERRTGYAVSIALISRAGDPVLGVVYIPDLEECYTCVKGQGVSLNGLELHRSELKSDVLNLYWDVSFRSEDYFEEVLAELHRYAQESKLEVRAHFNFGGVRNAVSVMRSAHGCYFKFPKKRKGCGSIWDYAATRLFFEELNLKVGDALGNQLNLNDPDTTFMNKGGVCYTTDEALAQWIYSLCQRLTSIQNPHKPMR